MSERTPEPEPRREPPMPGRRRPPDRTPPEREPHPPDEDEPEATKQATPLLWLRPPQYWGRSMKKLFLATVAAGALYAGTAGAVPIAGGSELSINGSDTFVGAVGGSAFVLDFVGAGNVGGQSGDFSIVPNCTACVTMIAQLTETSTNFQLYSVAEAGVTSSLTAGNITSFAITAGAGGLESLTISGAGVLNLTGRDPTPGFYDLTTQGPSGTAEVTFSNTAIAAAPEPASLSLLGVAVGGFGLTWLNSRRQRRRLLDKIT